jgi:hypothetical protein
MLHYNLQANVQAEKAENNLVWRFGLIAASAKPCRCQVSEFYLISRRLLNIYKSLVSANTPAIRNGIVSKIILPGSISIKHYVFLDAKF